MAEDVDPWALGDLETPWCLRVVVTLGVAELLAAGTTKVDDIAAARSCDPEMLRRVVRHLVDKGIFTEPAPGEFGLTGAGRQLTEPGVRLGFDLDGIGGRMTGAWTSLLTAVRTGRPAYQEVFGRPFWADLDANPHIAESFDELMGPGHGTPDPEVLVAGGWDAVRTVADVGGGSGGLLAEVLRARPGVHGILVDLPRTVARAPEVFAAAGVSDRATVSGQSFFEALPPGADVYLLKSILADWPDPEATAILRRCAEAARPDGRVVVLSGVSPGTPPGGGDLLMMVLVGGKERSLAEFREIAARAGLVVTASGANPNGRYIVECRPA